MSFLCSTSVLNEARSLPGVKRQKTLKDSVSARGVALFTGEEVAIQICPLHQGRGIVFQRVDLPHQPILPALLEHVQATSRCTMVADKGIAVQTIEHILAAFKALGIDNALVEISGCEVPIFDGSSSPFVETIDAGGVVECEEERNIYSIETPIFWSQGDVHLVALPSDEYRISYTLHYPHSSFIGSQFYSVVVDQESFRKEIAPCRTFSIYEEIAPMIQKGLIKGGSLENAVIIKEDKVVNPEGLRFPDEMVRHKVLDLIGDLSLVPVPFLAHIVAIRSGHASNNAFAKELFNHIKMENS